VGLVWCATLGQKKKMWGEQVTTSSGVQLAEETSGPKKILVRRMQLQFKRKKSARPESDHRTEKEKENDKTLQRQKKK